MRSYVPILIGACLLAGMVVVGAAAADPVEEDSRIANETTAEDEGQVGICVVGAGGPCNENSTEASDEEDSGELTKVPPEPDRVRDTGGTERDADVGTCVVGAGGPCNGEDAASTESDDVGICVTGVGGPCNDVEKSLGSEKIDPIEAGHSPEDGYPVTDPAQKVPAVIESPLTNVLGLSIIG